ncbi:membrane protein [Pseudomonas sp. Pc102]|uniref:alpha/beta hydrolase n=1 Tax=Pseudomonas sp. Pc102 TaxID=2678261 RepID=UPI001BCE7AB5|nr:alpha/beta hydrolase [Pseudomonas sp. Pc102]BBP85836.1 membrane protein [Pseudomonas sp. Pc102]
MRTGIIRWAGRGALLLALAMSLVFAVRVLDIQGEPSLEPWHRFVPEELDERELDQADWSAWMNAEARVFAQVREQVSEQLEAEEQVPANRYFPGSPLYPGRFSQDWNRSYVLRPEGEPVGAVVMLHGLTDSPYSLRHLALRYRQAGFVVLGLRLPGHGTVPAALTDVSWEQWLAATRLAMREARRLVGAQRPLRLVGYSNGGALALKYSLDALEDPSLPRAERLVLLSPMLGVAGYARFAGLAGLPAVFPAFAKAAWLDLLPEYNPFKYNSFPVNGARQSYQLTAALQEQLLSASRRDGLRGLPPLLTFQSVVDATVSTSAVVESLYRLVPDNGSELVLFDINRSVDFGPLLRPDASLALARLLPPPPRAYRTAVITNATASSREVVERVIEAGGREEWVRPLDMAFPRELFSLSHVALPFPDSDGLYGRHPDAADDFGIHLGNLSLRGERGVLVMNMDALQRATSNPFFPYLLQRLERVEGLAR